MPEMSYRYTFRELIHRVWEAVEMNEYSDVGRNEIISAITCLARAANRESSEYSPEPVHVARRRVQRQWNSRKLAWFIKKVKEENESLGGDDTEPDTEELWPPLAPEIMAELRREPEIQAPGIKAENESTTDTSDETDDIAV